VRGGELLGSGGIWTGAAPHELHLQVLVLDLCEGYFGYEPGLIQRLDFEYTQIENFLWAHELPWLEAWVRQYERWGRVSTVGISPQREARGRCGGSLLFGRFGEGPAITCAWEVRRPRLLRAGRFGGGEAVLSPGIHPLATQVEVQGLAGAEGASCVPRVRTGGEGLEGSPFGVP